MSILKKIFNKPEAVEDEDQLFSLIKPYLKSDGTYPDGELRISKTRKKEGRIISGELDRVSLRTIEDIGIFDYLKTNYGGGKYTIKVYVSNKKEYIYQGTCQYDIFSDIEIIAPTDNNNLATEKQLNGMIVQNFFSMVNKMMEKIENPANLGKSEIESILMKRALEKDDLKSAVNAINSIKELMGGFTGNSPIPNITEDNTLTTVLSVLAPTINAFAGKLAGLNIPQTPIMESPILSSMELPGHAQAPINQNIPIAENKPDETGFQKPITPKEEEEPITDNDIFEIMFLSPIVKLVEQDSKEYERIATMIFGAVTHTMAYFPDAPHPALDGIIQGIKTNDIPKITSSYTELSGSLGMQPEMANEVGKHLVNLFMEQEKRNAKI